MGARQSGSAASGMVLYDADEWKSKVHLYGRDCAYAYTDNPALGADMSATYVRAADAGRLGATESEVVTGNDAFGGVVRVPGTAPGMSGCRQSQQSVSVVPVDSLPAYAGGTYRSVALPGQPFSFAGDTILTAGKRQDGTDTIRVDRLYGDQSNEFTIVNVLKDFPTAPPYATLQIGAASKEQVDALPIPYAFNDEVGIKHPSVSTQSAVYFAVNPSTAMLEGFQKWCRGDAIAPLQLQVLSSYGGVRVWRIEPYTFCPVGDDGRPGCGAGHVRFVDLPDPMLDNSAEPVNDPARCGREFTVRVTSLEYLNSDNIAVTALRATLQTYDIANRAPYEGEGTFRVYYYNPGRNALQDVGSLPHPLSVPTTPRLAC